MVAQDNQQSNNSDADLNSKLTPESNEDVQRTLSENDQQQEDSSS